MSRTRLAAVLLLSAVLLVRAVAGFSAGTGIVGLVVDGAGKPVPGAEVRALLGERPRAITLTGRILGLAPEEIPQAYVAAHGSRGVIPRSIVYPDGTYRVTGLGPGAWTVTAGTRQRAVTGKVTFQPGQRSATLDLTLPDRFPVSGWVLGPDGKGVAGARIGIGLSNRESSSREDDFFESPPVEIRSREDGSFETLLVNGSYEVGVMGPDDAESGLAQTRLPQPIVVADAPVDGIEIPMQRRLVLRGCIPGLLPGERATILISNENAGRAPQTDPDGCYQVSDLGPGAWMITARLRDVPGGEGRQIDRRLALSPDVPETTFDLDFSLGSRTLTVRPATAWKPGDLYMMMLFLLDGTSLTESLAPGEDGAFHVGRLREGTYRVQIRDNQGKLRIDEPVDLSTDRDLVVEIP